MTALSYPIPFRVVHCVTTKHELHHEKTSFFPYEKTKTLISLAVTAKLISAFVFDT